MNKGIVLMAFLLFVLFAPLASAANTYELTAYRGTPYNVGSDYIFPFNYSGTCQTKLSTTNTYIVPSPFTSTIAWYSPTSASSLSTSNMPLNSDSYCRSYGGTTLQTVSKEPATNIYENAITLNPLLASSGFAQTKVNYKCDANNNQWANITVTPENTSYGACQWIMTKRTPISDSYTQQELLNDFIAGYNDCGASNFANRFGHSTCDVYENVLCPGMLCNGTLMFIYPFNSTGGYMTYHFTIPNKIVGFQNHFSYYVTGTGIYYIIQLINLQSGAIELLHNESDVCGGLSCSYEITNVVQGFKNNLDLNAPYAFAVSFYASGLAAPTLLGLNTYPPVLNISILAEQPNYECTDFTPCVNGSQVRTCHDTKGLVPDKNELQDCFSFAQNAFFLGFDSGYTANSWYCSEGGYNIITSLCSRDPNVRPRRIPNGWYRNGQYVTDITARSGWVQDYVDVDLADYYAPDQITSEGSLKLWFIPRKPFVPVYNATGTGQVVCINTSEGQVGGMQYYVNDTFWISRNITALSPYMTISYRSKKCPITPQQTAYYTLCSVPCQLAGNCQNSGLCANTTAIPGTSSSAFGDDYYTGDGCPQIPSPSTLGVEIENIDTGEIIQTYLKTVTATNWLLGYQEDNINNMNISAVYKLSFAAYPSGGITTNDGNCVMIDDVNVNFRDSPTTCTSGCTIPDYNGDGINDYTYIESTRLSATSCTVQIKTFDPRCTPAAVTQDAAAMQAGTENQTCDGTTLVTKNPVTAEYSFFPDNAYCKQKQSEESGSLTPTSGDAIMQGVSFLLMTPIFFSFIFALGTSYFVTTRFKEGSGGTQMGFITFIAILGILSVVPYPTGGTFFPIWFFIALAIIAALVYSSKFGIFHSGGGG